MPMLQTALTLIPILGGTRAPSAPPPGYASAGNWSPLLGTMCCYYG